MDRKARKGSIRTDDTKTTPFWSLSAAAVLVRVQSSPEGLSCAEAAARLHSSGPNRTAAGPALGAWRLALRQFENPLVLLLGAAAGISWILHEHDDAILILAIVGASSLAGFWQELSAGNAVKALMKLVAVRATVIRDGREQAVAVEEIVPGDIVQLGAGSIVPADARLVKSTTLYVDEASLTGESFPSEKSEEVSPADAPAAQRRAALYAGTHVISGSATAVIVATGEGTEFAHVMDRLRRAAPMPDFERGLQQFGYLLVKVALLLVVGVFAVTARRHQDVLGGLMFALAISVGITPELLPAIVSINLARGARRMAARRVIVKRLDAIENFGSMTVLCSDKTGTLTEGVVSLAGSWTPDGRENVAVLDLAAVNAGLQQGLPSPIDDAISAAHPLAAGSWCKLDEVPYDFHRRRLSVLAEDSRGQRVLVTKGALSSVLEVCTQVLVDGKTAPLDSVREHIDELYRGWSTDGLRVLGVARRAMDGAEHAGLDDEAGLVFAGFIALSDVPKPGIAATIAKLAGLGVALKMITGDNRNVAAAVAIRVGISSPRVLCGDEIRCLSLPALAARATETDVFAEVEPNQKETILVALKTAGHVVGFLGDGINDAPALHTADVGISVASAVDVAKDAAAIVLLDHDLDVLAEGVLQGRQTFENTMKYVRITTSANFGNMLSMAAVVPLLPFLPLLPAQILLNNFLSDIPAMTIAGDRVDPETSLLPGKWDIHAIRNFMMTFGLISSAFDLMTFAVLLLVLHTGAEEFRSAWFLESLLTEICILLVMRTRRPFLSSRPATTLLAASLGTALLATSLLYYQPAAVLLGFVPLPLPVLLTVLAITGAYVVASEIAKRRFFAPVSASSAKTPSM